MPQEGVRGLTPAIIVIIFISLLTGLVVAPSDEASATTYPMQAGYNFGSTDPDTVTDYTLVIDVSAPSANFDSETLVFFTPADASLAASADLPLGAIVGDILANNVLGLLNGPCNTILPFNFTFWNATVDTANTIDPLPFPTVNPLSVLAEDSDGNDLQDQVDRYPSYNNTLFDPDGSGPAAPLTPLARYSAHDFVAGLDVILQWITFDLGELAAFPTPHQLSQLASPFGYGAFIVFQDDTSPDSPTALTDFCNFSATVNFLGTTADNPDTVSDEGGAIRYRNPPAGTGIAGTGTHLWETISASVRDADDDGIDNDLDSCPLDFDDSWDPRAADETNDPDGDGIPNSCDPTPIENVGLGDHDGDGFPNRQDNCPIVANPDQAESETGLIPSNGGPATDGIGDACDPNITIPDGHYHAVLNRVAMCVGGSDGDGDGYCDATETLLGSASDPEHLGVHYPLPLNDSGADPIPPAAAGVAQPCNDGVDNDADGQTDEADSGCTGTSDIDGDGFDENAELFMGTSPWHACTAAPGKHDAWPPDTNNDGRVTIADVLALKPAFGALTGDSNYTARLDLTADGRISIADVLIMKDPFGSSC